MVARKNLRRRIDDALAVADPLALADATEAHINGRSPDDVRELIVRSAKRMDQSELTQLGLYVNLERPDDLVGHRFAAFLRQNPRALSALDPDAAESILADLGDLPAIERVRRRLSTRTSLLVAAVVAIAVLPLAAQYAHQRGLLQGLSDVVVPPPIVPFVQRFSPAKARAATPAHRASHLARATPHAHRVAVRHAPRKVHAHHVLAYTPHQRHSVRHVGWKFDRGNNPYFNPVRWRHPYVAPRLASEPFAARARLSVNSYLQAVIAGNVPAALVHLGLSRTGDPHAVAELPIVTRNTHVAILGSKAQADGSEQVQVRILTGTREYFEEFSVARDGSATRIVEHYYIPVNHQAQVAVRTRTP